MYPEGYPTHNNVTVPKLVEEYFNIPMEKNIKTRIVMSHYSMYCSFDYDPQCLADGDAEHLQNYHSIFQNAGVTLSLGAHVHLY